MLRNNTKPLANPQNDETSVVTEGDIDDSHMSGKSLISIVKRYDENKWIVAFKRIWPIYFAVHLAALVLDWLSTLFKLKDYDYSTVLFHSLWENWYQWDTQHYTGIAIGGYTKIEDTAFFPLYPLLIRIVKFVFPIHNQTTAALLAALLVANVAGLVMLVVFYQLVREDFDDDCAYRTVLYFSIFPTALFFIAGYTESLFVCLLLLSFYCMRRGYWWLSGLFGLFACLTRSGGVFLLLPFCYEYLRQQQFQLKKIRFSVLAGVLIPMGVALFSFYCYWRFGDFLSFSHVQATTWFRETTSPWTTFNLMFIQMQHDNSPLNYHFVRNAVDLVPDILVLIVLILSVVGPWRFHHAQYSYCILAISLFIFLQMFPVPYAFPMQAMGRYMLEVFPAFIVLSRLGKNRTFDLNYLIVASTTFACLLMLFITGRWII